MKLGTPCLSPPPIVQQARRVSAPKTKVRIRKPVPIHKRIKIPCLEPSLILSNEQVIPIVTPERKCIEVQTPRHNLDLENIREDSEESIHTHESEAKKLMSHSHS
jgi:hypothetical protein